MSQYFETCNNATTRLHRLRLVCAIDPVERHRNTTGLRDCSCATAPIFGIPTHVVTGFAALTGDKDKRPKLKTCVPLLLAIEKPARDGDRLLLDVAGTRAVHWLLRFDPKLCAPILKGLVDGVAVDETVLLIRDGLGSRCIIDGILEGQQQESAFCKALSNLAAKLTGHWVNLSGDRIGHHTVKKLFHALTDLKAREVLVQELVGGKKRLSGTSMGRSIITECLVHEYETKGEAEWRRLIKKRAEKETWVDDIVHGGRSEQGGKRKSESATDDREKRRRWGLDDYVESK